MIKKRESLSAARMQREGRRAPEAVFVQDEGRPAHDSSREALVQVRRVHFKDGEPLFLLRGPERNKRIGLLNKHEKSCYSPFEKKRERASSK